MARCFQRLTRRKIIDLSSVTETKLARCLTTLDLTALGIGSTLGAGIYVVAGQVAREDAGPSVIISFFIAAVASVLAGLCYAEFGARVPKTGSAYVYSYVTVGELLAFIIGWNLILEYVIGTASVARAWSSYFDSLIGGKISHYLNSTVHMDINSLSEYPDFFALGITLLLTFVLAIGVRESSIVNNIFTGVNLLVVAYVIICGMFKADIHNWEIPEEDVPAGKANGDGGFFPFGVSGTLSGAATCFYAFVGFDCIATTGEEVKNPQKAIPVAIIVSLFACFMAYFGISAVLTLIIPYYTLDSNAPIPVAFAAIGWPVAKYVIAVGAVCGLSTSLLGAMFPMPRVIYAMASDGLLFRCMAYVSERFKTPLIATLVAGWLAGIMAMLFDLKELVNMMSIGTLLAYTLVAASTLILRYQSDADQLSDTENLIAPRASISCLSDLSYLIRPIDTSPTEFTGSIVKYCVLLLGIMVTGLSACLIFMTSRIFTKHPSWWALLIVVILALLVIMIVIIIARQPENKDFITFKVPAAPLVTSVSIFVNVYLMLKLPTPTWIRFGVWMAIGFLIYFGYGIWHSSEETRWNEELETTSTTLGPEILHPPPPSPNNERSQLIGQK